MSSHWTTRWLALAAAWNIIGGVAALWNPGQHFALLYVSTLSLADPLQLFFYRCTWINVIAWGLAYALAAGMSESRRALLLAGAIGKSAYCVACIALFLSGGGTRMLLAAGAVDLLLALLFIAGLRSGNGRRYGDESGRSYITRL